MASIPKAPLIAVIGATGTGKSKLAVALARRFNGEVVNGDALQLYEGLPIVTNKVCESEMHGIKHHLLGRLSLHDEPWSVSQFTAEAIGVVDDIMMRGKLPILVGGTHYYTQNLLLQDQTLGDNPGQQLSATQQEEKWPILKTSNSTILEKLREVDPAMAARWHPNDARRIRRSLEIWLQTGKRASELYLSQRENPYSKQRDEISIAQESALRYNSIVFCTHMEKDQLDIRITDRVNEMLSAGLLDEVRHMYIQSNELSRHGSPPDRSRGIWIAIGYKEFEDYLAALDAETAEEETMENLKNLAITQMQTATKKYARSQNRWIKQRLIPALIRESREDTVFILHCTSTSEWIENVEVPAIKLTEAFLQGRPLEVSLERKDLLAALLSSSTEQVNSSLPQVMTCQVCGVVMTKEAQLERHSRTKKHRRAIRRMNSPNRQIMLS